MKLTNLAIFSLTFGVVSCARLGFYGSGSEQDSSPTDADQFTLDATIPEGQNVTATLTDASGSTSAFSAPYAFP